MATDNSIKIHQYQDGGKAVLIDFGKGKIGIGLHDNSVNSLGVVLQELKEPKEIGAFLTKEERQENFENPVNELDVILSFPNVKSIDNFIETLKIYRQKVFFPNVKTRSA